MLNKQRLLNPHYQFNRFFDVRDSLFFHAKESNSALSISPGLDFYFYIKLKR